MSVTWLLSELVNQIGGDFLGSDCVIARAASLDTIDNQAIGFVASPKYLPMAKKSQLAALVVLPEMATDLTDHCRLIITHNPHLYFTKILHLLYPQTSVNPTIHPSAVIHPTAEVSKDCQIGANVVIGANTIIAEGCIIGDGCVIEHDVKLGESCLLHPRVTIAHHCHIGRRVILHSGSIIGSDGFGNIWDEATQSWLKIPQIGRVHIGDDVEIGANTTVDRGALDDTVIHTGARIDNLVQIAHNVHIGAHTVIAACVGIAGSTKIGSRCQIGGAAMLGGHLNIADGTVIGGATVVNKTIIKADFYASNYPLQTYREWTKNAIYIRQLSKWHDLIKQIKDSKS